MQLEKIKLAGFKSFVDPTVLELRSPLVAVVGPNGCGKSNIIDAVRWVMGESSAKNLRGESPVDVIFNGSATRKPVGQASVELLFDNSDGSLGGEYARFSEISVRREVGRDGQSTYFLNGTRCRRKDITDVFLGTGLGPRSYAIIEQGMISRVIEAKPEELRTFLEEAAGISLYRKRRQETETRIKHTRENLDRLNDVRQELEKQLERLKRQAEAAERYRQYKIEHDRIEAELSALRWQAFNAQLQEKMTAIRKFSTELEEKQAIRVNLDLEVETQRINYTEKTDAWKVEQGQYYELGNRIARIEQSLQYHREREQGLEEDKEAAKQAYQQISVQIEQDKARLLDLQNEIVKLGPDSKAAETALKQSEILLLEIEAAIQKWNQEFEIFQVNAEKTERLSEVEKARIIQLKRQSDEAKSQLDRLEQERIELNTTPSEEKLAQLERELLTEDTETNSIGTELNALSLHLTEERKLSMYQSNVLDEKKSRLQSLQGRMASLEALQQAALGKTNTVVKDWLKTHDLMDYPRLGEVLTVEKGFEYAVETVLGSALEAICVSEIEAIMGWIGELNEGKLTFMDATVKFNASKTSTIGLDLLINKVKTDLPIQDLLIGVYVADKLSEALQKQKMLKEGESIITREGVWLGHHWLKVQRGTEESHTGLLVREVELKEIGSTIAVLQEEIATLETELAKQREKIQDLESKREGLHQAQQNHGRFLNELSAKVSAERAHLGHLRERLARLEAETAEQKQKLTVSEEEITLAQINLQAAVNTIENNSKNKIALQGERERLQDLLRKANQELTMAREKAHAAILKEQTIITQSQAVEEGLHRLLKQQETVKEKMMALENQLQALKAPEKAMREDLEELLNKKIKAEDMLNISRSQLEDIEQALRTLEKRRNFLEDEAHNIRSTLESLRMEWQAMEVRCQTVQEKLGEMGKTLEEIIKTLSPEATEPLLAQALEQIIKRIERLGAINLVAIEEYQSELERKQYLDSQHQDLTEALETLENAIRKIDKETRVRFKETFDKVNIEFQTLFPGLFGGGQAYLELSGEDLLDAGVSVMARPPGKRNSSIHLLSGGEKALTAVAMVFAIFQLNPAPFCLLDEVDAPLDDANVGRYCELVKRLSNTVQFVFVTHNKLAMEIAHHLVGVTMKEPGVSRLVSVDVEEAAELVAS